jgi:hypothetical protein
MADVQRILRGCPDAAHVVHVVQLLRQLHDRFGNMALGCGSEIGVADLIGASCCLGQFRTQDI